MRAASVIVAEVLAELASAVRPGVTTAELDALAEELTRKTRRACRRSRATTSAGRVFPASLCISINDEVVHGIPSARRVLREGDIVGLDFGVVLRGLLRRRRGDRAGRAGERRGRAADAGRRARRSRPASRRSRPGARIGDISAAIQDARRERRLLAWCATSSATASAGACTRIRRCRTSDRRDRGIRLREGMVLAIEPMVNAGGPEVVRQGRRLDGGRRATAASRRTSSTRSRSSTAARTS